MENHHSSGETLQHFCIFNRTFEEKCDQQAIPRHSISRDGDHMLHMSCHVFSRVFLVFSRVCHMSCHVFSALGRAACCGGLCLRLDHTEGRHRKDPSQPGVVERAEDPRLRHGHLGGSTNGVTTCTHAIPTATCLPGIPLIGLLVLLVLTMIAGN